MDVILNGEKLRVAFRSGAISDLLHKMMVSREEVIAKVNGKIVPEDAEITSKDKVEITKVVFGG